VRARREDTAKKRRGMSQDARPRLEVAVRIAQVAAAVDALRKNAGPSELRELRQYLAYHADAETPTEDEAVMRAALGAVPTLLEVIAQPVTAATLESMSEALWSLTNIAGSTKDVARHALAGAPRYAALVDIGGDLPADKKLALFQLHEHAAWVLGNLAAEPEFRAKLFPLIAATFAGLAVHVNAGDPTCAKTLAWATGHVIEADVPLDPLRQVALQAMRFLRPTAEAGREEVLAELFWILAFSTANRAPVAEALLADNIGLAFVHLLGVCDALSAPHLVAVPLLRTLGNIATSSEQCAATLGATPDLVTSLVKALSSSHRAVRKEAAWAIASLAAFRGPVNDALLSAAGAVLTALLGAESFDVKKEAAFALFNVASHVEPAKVAALLLRPEAVQPVLGLLRVADVEAVAMALRFVDLLLHCGPEAPRVLEEAGVIAALEHLQTQESQAMWSYASRLIDEFYGEDMGQEDDASMAARPDPSQYPAWRNRSTGTA
jgi:hypothetical protein